LLHFNVLHKTNSSMLNMLHNVVIRSVICITCLVSCFNFRLSLTSQRACRVKCISLPKFAENKIYIYSDTIWKWGTKITTACMFSVFLSRLICCPKFFFKLRISLFLSLTWDVLKISSQVAEVVWTTTFKLQIIWQVIEYGTTPYTLPVHMACHQLSMWDVSGNLWYTTTQNVNNFSSIFRYSCALLQFITAVNWINVHQISPLHNGSTNCYGMFFQLDINKSFSLNNENTKTHTKWKEFN